MLTPSLEYFYRIPHTHLFRRMREGEAKRQQERERERKSERERERETARERERDSERETARERERERERLPGKSIFGRVQVLPPTCSLSATPNEA